MLEIPLQTPGKLNISIECSIRNNISHLKEVVCEMFRIPTDILIIKYEQIILKDNTKVSDIDLIPGCSFMIDYSKKLSDIIEYAPIESCDKDFIFNSLITFIKEGFNPVMSVLALCCCKGIIELAAELILTNEVDKIDCPENFKELAGDVIKRCQDAVDAECARINEQKENVASIEQWKRIKDEYEERLRIENDEQTVAREAQESSQKDEGETSKEKHIEEESTQEIEIGNQRIDEEKILPLNVSDTKNTDSVKTMPNGDSCIKISENDANSNSQEHEEEISSPWKICLKDKEENYIPEFQETIFITKNEEEQSKPGSAETDSVQRNEYSNFDKESEEQKENNDSNSKEDNQRNDSDFIPGCNDEESEKDRFISDNNEEHSNSPYEINSLSSPQEEKIPENDNESKVAEGSNESNELECKHQIDIDSTKEHSEYISKGIEENCDESNHFTLIYAFNQQQTSEVENEYNQSIEQRKEDNFGLNLDINQQNEIQENVTGKFEEKTSIIEIKQNEIEDSNQAENQTRKDKLENTEQKNEHIYDKETCLCNSEPTVLHTVESKDKSIDTGENEKEDKKEEINYQSRIQESFENVDFEGNQNNYAHPIDDQTSFSTLLPEVVNISDEPNDNIEPLKKEELEADNEMNAVGNEEEDSQVSESDNIMKSEVFGTQKEQSGELSSSQIAVKILREDSDSDSEHRLNIFMRLSIGTEAANEVPELQSDSSDGPLPYPEVFTPESKPDVSPSQQKEDEEHIKELMGYGLPEKIASKCWFSATGDIELAKKWAKQIAQNKNN